MCLACHADVVVNVASVPTQTTHRRRLMVNIDYTFIELLHFDPESQ